MNNREVSVLIAFIIIAAVTIALVIAVAYWMIPLTSIFKRDITVELTPRIYSPELNYAVLNDEAEFSIHVINNRESRDTVKLIVTAEGSVVNITMWSLDAKQSEDITFTQKLMCTGEWVMKVEDSKGNFLTSYTFVVFVNRDQADIAINQWKNIQTANNISIISIVIAIVSAIAAVISAISTYSNKEEIPNWSKVHDRQRYIEQARTIVKQDIGYCYQDLTRLEFIKVEEKPTYNELWLEGTFSTQNGLRNFIYVLRVTNGKILRYDVKKSNLNYLID